MFFWQMEEGKTYQILQDSWVQYGDHLKNNDQWIKIDHDAKKCESEASISSSEDSMVSIGSSISSGDTADDASSLASSSNSSGSLYDLSELMVQLPIKRGLSKFYQGKSESFTSLSRVTCIEDLAKKAIPFKRKMKGSKSCENGLNSYKPYILPKAIISKKVTKGNCLSSNFQSKRGNFISSRPSLTPIQKKKC